MREPFLQVVGQREVDRLVGTGVSRTRGIAQAAAALGVPFGTLRDAVNRRLVDKSAP